MAPTPSYAASTTRPQSWRGYWLAALVALLCATLTNQWPAQWSIPLPDHSGPRTEQQQAGGDAALPRASLNIKWLHGDDEQLLAEDGEPPVPSRWALRRPAPAALTLPQSPDDRANRHQALGKGPRHPHAPPVLS